MVRTWSCLVGALLLLPAGHSAIASPDSTAESRKYWVFFKDKEEAAKSSARANISARTLERRALRGRKTGAWEDLAVSRSYVGAVEAHGAVVVHESRWLNAVSARASDEVASRIRTLPFVQAVRSVASIGGAPLPPLEEQAFQPTPGRGSGPAKATDFDYGGSLQQLSFVDAIGPLENGLNGSGVRIGFLDTQFDFSHPAMRHIADEGRLLEERDFTLENQQQYGGNQSNYHGLNTSSIALGFDPGNLIGPAFGAEVLAATTEFAPTETNLEEDNLVAGLEWMEAEGVDVVNISLGYSTFDPGESSYSPSDMDGETGITTRAADRAAALGVVMVVSAGNLGGDPTWGIISTPADGDSVIAVGAAQLDSTRSSFSSRGPTADGRLKPEVSALGSSVLVASRGGFYTRGSGTSFSSPMVAGIVCQMLQVNPALDPAAVLTILRQTASQTGNPDNQLGWGIVNAGAAVEAALLLADVDEIPSDTRLSAAYPNPFTDSFTIEVSGSLGGRSASLTFHDALGREIDVIFSGTLATGTNRFTYHAPDLASGVYFYVLRTDVQLASGPLVHIR